MANRHPSAGPAGPLDFMEVIYRGSDLTSKTSVYKKHTQMALQRYTHSKSLAKIDTLPALRLPWVDKHCPWVKASRTPWDLTTFGVIFPSSVNVLNKASHWEWLGYFKDSVHFNALHFVLYFLCPYIACKRKRNTPWMCFNGVMHDTADIVQNISWVI